MVERAVVEIVADMRRFSVDPHAVAEEGSEGWDGWRRKVVATVAEMVAEAELQLEAYEAMNVKRQRLDPNQKIRFRKDVGSSSPVLPVERESPRDMSIVDTSTFKLTLFAGMSTAAAAEAQQQDMLKPELFMKPSNERAWIPMSTSAAEAPVFSPHEIGNHIASTATSLH